MRDDEVFIRMSRAERWQHGLLLLSFVVLALTGLPSLASESALLRAVFGRGEAGFARGLVHRVAAVAFIADIVWHLLYVLLTERGRRNIRDKAPRRQDYRDAAAFLTPGAPRPEFGRYSFIQKFEYWSMIGGSAVMIVTGLFMSGPSLALKIIPLWLFQVLVVIHGYEAVLAVVAILLGHMYSAHLAPGVFPMSRVWIDGRMTAADMRRFHPREYRRIVEERERGEARRATGAQEGSIIERE
jgi:cytochrome b subunit of formate dehydrogenase